MSSFPDEQLNPPEASAEDPEELLEFAGDPEMNDDAEVDSAAWRLDDWKAELRRDFEQWLESVDEIPDDGDEAGVEPGGEDTPGLYAFYEQLAAANAENRKSNRRTAEAFSQWSETLMKFDGELRLLREQMARQPAVQDEALPRSWCLALLEIVDRLHRFANALAAPPPNKWWVRDAHWRTAWDNQRQGLDILLSHVETLLARAGVTRFTTLHQPFDPAAMAAVAVEPSSQWPPQTVLEEVVAGYRLHGELLRVAQVKVSVSTNTVGKSHGPAGHPRGGKGHA
jgi:molecular chaperone GrpE (heat shock protein)